MPERKAASRFVQSLAAAAGDAELFKQAAALASTARQHELAAWELAAREAKSRMPTSSHDPWFQPAETTPSASAPKESNDP